LNQFIARQPIFDRKMNVFAYELLHRFDETQNFAAILSDPDKASSETIMSSFYGNSIEKITGDKPAFINFTQNLLEAGIATLFPNQYLVVEILEDVAPLPSVAEACRLLKEAGYTIALDDFVYRPELEPLIQWADIVKIDWLDADPEEIREVVRKLRPRSPRLLAEKVETHEIFQQAMDMGFSYFQGYFFSKPVIVSNKKIDPLMINYIQLIRQVSRTDVDFAYLARIIRRDVVLSYRLLRLVNSAYFGARHEVKSIRHALAILGLREIKKWISLLAMIGITSGKSDEIIRTSLIRGRFLETFGARHCRSLDSEQLFMSGLFSLLDVIMEMPMADVLPQLSGVTEIEEVLIESRGPIADILGIIAAYEHGKWEDAVERCRCFGVTEEQLLRLYLDAVSWSNAFL
jgi:EAL and modified HD-GYP domain-containing signal transduction protein